MLFEVLKKQRLKEYSFVSPHCISIFGDTSSLNEAVVDVLECNLRKTLNDKNSKPLGLATGKTMRPIYASLLNRLRNWSGPEIELLKDKWCSFNLDEYVGIQPQDLNSFTAYMWKNLGDPLGLKKHQINVPNGNTNDPKSEALFYSEELIKKGGLGLQLLGMGLNGHIGFNEPPCGLDSQCRVVLLSECTKKQNANDFSCDNNNLPKYAITLGIKEILAAEEIHLIVTGESKSRILRSLLTALPNDNLPASWLKRHMNLYIWVDKQAMILI